MKTGLGMWFVWCAGGHGMIPQFVHNSAEEAKKEAERLAKSHPETEFHVLQSVAFCIKQEVKWQTMPDMSNQEGLPF